MMSLRPYQAEARDAIIREWSAGNQKTLLVLPTGTGKTVVSAKVSKEQINNAGKAPILFECIKNRKQAGLSSPGRIRQEYIAMVNTF